VQLRRRRQFATLLDWNVVERDLEPLRQAVAAIAESEKPGG
jgi:hypothetical protein